MATTSFNREKLPEKCLVRVTNSVHSNTAGAKNWSIVMELIMMLF